MKTNDIVYSTSPKVVCDGSNNVNNGHPRIYLDMETEGEIVCPYCSRKFILKTDEKNG